MKANKSLKESIQLCATVCSAGRELKDDEMEAILAYFWTLEVKVSDLNLSKSELDVLNNAIQSDNNKEEAINLIQSKTRLFCSG